MLFRSDKYLHCNNLWTNASLRQPVRRARQGEVRDPKIGNQQSAAVVKHRQSPCGVEVSCFGCVEPNRRHKSTNVIGNLCGARRKGQHAVTTKASKRIEIQIECESLRLRLFFTS